MPSAANAAAFSFTIDCVNYSEVRVVFDIFVKYYWKEVNGVREQARELARTSRQLVTTSMVHLFLASSTCWLDSVAVPPWLHMFCVVDESSKFFY